MAKRAPLLILQSIYTEWCYSLIGTFEPPDGMQSVSENEFDGILFASIDLKHMLIQYLCVCVPKRNCNTSTYVRGKSFAVDLRTT